MNSGVRTGLMDAIAAVEDVGGQYAIMGGLAVRAYGIPRPTFDVDLLMVLDRGSLTELFDQLEQRGYGIDEPYRRGWVDEVGEMPLVKAKVYLQTGSVDLDLYLCEGDFLESVMRRRQKADVEGTILWLISPEDLLLFKLMAARTKDWTDIFDVLFVVSNLDRSYIEHWVEVLKLTERWRSALEKGPF